MPMDDCSADDVRGPPCRLHTADRVFDSQCRLHRPLSSQHLQRRHITVVELPPRFQSDGETGHVRKMGQQERHAFAAVPAVVGTGFDVDSHEAGARNSVTAHTSVTRRSCWLP